MAGIAALAFAYLLSQFYRSFLAVLTPALEADLGTTNADLSFGSGAFFATFALSQFVIGVSLDRFGPRRTGAALLAVGGGGGALLFAAAVSPAMIAVAMALIGIGCAPVLMASLFIFAKTFSAARFAVLTSWFVGLGSLGNVIGAAPLAAAVEASGWRMVMAGLAITTLLTALAVATLVRDPAPDDTAGAVGAGKSGFAGFRELLSLRVLWPIIPLTTLNYAAAAGIRGLWAGPYLTEVHGADALTIGEITLFMAIAMVLGSFIYGPLDTLFRTRKWVVVAGNGISLATLGFLALHPGMGLQAATWMLMLVGVSGLSYGLMMAHARAFFPPHLLGRGVTLMNFFSIGGVGLMQFATGVVVTEAAVQGDAAVAYQAQFGFYALMLAAALAIYLFSRDAKP